MDANDWEVAARLSTLEVFMGVVLAQTILARGAAPEQSLQAMRSFVSSHFAQRTAPDLSPEVSMLVAQTMQESSERILHHAAGTLPSKPA